MNQTILWSEPADGPDRAWAVRRAVTMTARVEVTALKMAASVVKAM